MTTDTTALQERLWEAIAEARDRGERTAHDVDSYDIVDAVLPIIAAEVRAAQEPTDAEVEAAARAISAEQDRRIGLKAGAWWGGAEYRRNFAREDARAALSAARRDEEKR